MDGEVGRQPVGVGALLPPGGSGGQSQVTWQQVPLIISQPPLLYSQQWDHFQAQRGFWRLGVESRQLDISDGPRPSEGRVQEDPMAGSPVA